MTKSKQNTPKKPKESVLRLAGLVSIIMPVYNRARFLNDAIDSIRAQSYTNWELIIVDDGSTDESVSLASDLVKTIDKRVIVTEQENGGPAAARNRGFAYARGEFIAFFDSDDVWKPHHLTSCISAFEHHPSLSWVYSACERVDYFSGEVLLTNTFYDGSKPNLLFDAAISHSDGTYILRQDEAVKLQLNEGLDNGFQNSVLHRCILEQHLIPHFRVGEDRLFIIMALKSGYSMGFIDKINVTYRVHDENISDTNPKEANLNKRIAALKAFIDANKGLSELVSLSKSERRIHRQQLADQLFWELGYSLQQANNLLLDAKRTYEAAIWLYPWNLKYIKTYLGLLLKILTHKR